MPATARPAGSVVAPVVSADGIVTATASAFGTVLDIDFSLHGSNTSSALWVTVDRTVAGASIGLVRGLDEYPSIGAMTVGYDHEAPLGVEVTYRATARNAAGQVWKAKPVAVTIPAHRNRAWLKSLSTPALSMQLTGDSYPDWERDITTGVFRAPGRRGPSTRQGKRQYGSGTLTLHALTAAEISGLDVLLDAGGVYLLQADAANKVTRPDVYVIVGQDQFAQPFADPEYRSVPLPVTRVDRPSTRGSRVSLPGHTIADLNARYATLGDYPSPLSQLMRF